MILHIFFGDKGAVLPLSYWIYYFCRFQSAPEFLRSWACAASCQASAATFPWRFVSWLQIGSAWGFEQNLWLLFFEVVQDFLTDLDMYVESTWKSITKKLFCTFSRFIWYTVIFSVHTWKTEDSEGENLLHFCSILIVSSSNTAWPLIYLKMSSWELINTM